MEPHLEDSQAGSELPGARPWLTGNACRDADMASRGGSVYFYPCLSLTTRGHLNVLCATVSVSFANVPFISWDALPLLDRPANS